MSRNKKILLIVVLVILSYLFFAFKRQKNLYDKSCLKPSGGKINSLTMDKGDIDLKMKFNNKMDYGVHVFKQDYDVLFNGTPIAKIKDNNKFYYPAHSSVGYDKRTGKKTDISVNIKFIPRDVIQVSLQNLKDLLTNRDNIKVVIQGYMAVGSGFIFLNSIPIYMEYTLKELLAPSASTEC